MIKNLSTLSNKMKWLISHASICLFFFYSLDTEFNQKQCNCQLWFISHFQWNKDLSKWIAGVATWSLVSPFLFTESNHPKPNQPESRVSPLAPVSPEDTPNRTHSNNFPFFNKRCIIPWEIGENVQKHPISQCKRKGGLLNSLLYPYCRQNLNGFVRWPMYHPSTKFRKKNISYYFCVILLTNRQTGLKT